jgi:hypothetical protein
MGQYPQRKPNWFAASHQPETPNLRNQQSRRYRGLQAGQGFLCVAAERVFADRKYLRKVSDLKSLPDIRVKVAERQVAGHLPYLDYQGEERRSEKPHIGEIQHDSLSLHIFEHLEDFSLEAFNLRVS